MPGLSAPACHCVAVGRCPAQAGSLVASWRSTAENARTPRHAGRRGTGSLFWILKKRWQYNFVGYRLPPKSPTDIPRACKIFVALQKRCLIGLRQDVAFLYQVNCVSTPPLAGLSRAVRLSSRRSLVKKGPRCQARSLRRSCPWLVFVNQHEHETRARSRIRARRSSATKQIGRFQQQAEEVVT
jgi:hypothetical protein